MNGVAECNLAKLERKVKTLAKRQIEQIPRECDLRIRRSTRLTKRIRREPFRGKSLLDLLEKQRVHNTYLQVSGQRFELTHRPRATTFPSLTPELPLPSFAAVTGAGVSFWAASDCIAEAFEISVDGGFEPV